MNEMDEVLKLREENRRLTTRIRLMRAILAREMGDGANEPCDGASQGGLCPAHAMLYIADHDEAADVGVSFRDPDTGKTEVVQHPDALGFGGLGLMMPPAEC